jgi:cytochrome-b5 reductase
MGNAYVSRPYFDGVYIPAGLIVAGSYITKPEFVPYAAALALVLGGFKMLTMRMSSFLHVAIDDAAR